MEGPKLERMITAIRNHSQHTKNQKLKAQQTQSLLGSNNTLFDI